MSEALEVAVYAPIASFRDPMYSGVQVGLPVPPPSTVGGLLAACAGGWGHVPERTRFAMSFTAGGSGTDLETYWPVGRDGKFGQSTVKQRPFLSDCQLTVWLLADLDWWEHVVGNPTYPTRLGRSQDLAEITCRRVPLLDEPGKQWRALVPSDTPNAAGEPLHLSTANSLDRTHTTWAQYRWSHRGDGRSLSGGWSTPTGQAVVLLPQVHPTTAT